MQIKIWIWDRFYKFYAGNSSYTPSIIIGKNQIVSLELPGEKIVTDTDFFLQEAGEANISIGFTDELFTALFVNIVSRMNPLWSQYVIQVYGDDDSIVFEGIITTDSPTLENASIEYSMISKAVISFKAMDFLILLADQINKTTAKYPEETIKSADIIAYHLDFAFRYYFYPGGDWIPIFTLNTNVIFRPIKDFGTTGTLFSLTEDDGSAFEITPLDYYRLDLQTCTFKTESDGHLYLYAVLSTRLSATYKTAALKFRIYNLNNAELISYEFRIVGSTASLPTMTELEDLLKSYAGVSQIIYSDFAYNGGTYSTPSNVCIATQELVSGVLKFRIIIRLKGVIFCNYLKVKESTTKGRIMAALYLQNWGVRYNARDFRLENKSQKSTTESIIDIDKNHVVDKTFSMSSFEKINPFDSDVFSEILHGTNQDIKLWVEDTYNSFLQIPYLSASCSVGGISNISAGSVVRFTFLPHSWLFRVSSCITSPINGLKQITCYNLNK